MQRHAGRSIRNTFRDNIRDRADASSLSTRVPVRTESRTRVEEASRKERTVRSCIIAGPAEVNRTFVLE